MEETVWEHTWMRVPARSFPSWDESLLIFQGLRVGHECWGQWGSCLEDQCVAACRRTGVHASSQVRSRKKEGITVRY